MSSLPSPRLRWYARQSKALMQTGAVESAAEVCRRVLQCEGLSQDQKIWFERRLARCLQANGQLEEACLLYEKLLQYKQDWFLRKEFLELLAQCQRWPDALNQACSAALAPGENAKKINLFLMLADWLSKQSEIAQTHHLLVLRLRQDHGWPLPESLLKAAGHPAVLPQVNELLHQLKPFWQQNALQKSQVMERLQGTVHMLFPHGQAGFVQVNRSKRYYFQSRDFKGALELLKPGLPVSFELKQGFDRKKKSAYHAGLSNSPIALLTAILGKVMVMIPLFSAWCTLTINFSCGFRRGRVGIPSLMKKRLKLKRLRDSLSTTAIMKHNQQSPRCSP